MTFSEQIWYGLFKPSKYKELLELKAGRSVLYVAVIVLIMGLVTFVVPTAAVITGFGGMNKLFTETMAPVSYDGESLSIEEPFKLSADGIHFIVDSTYYTVPDKELRVDGTYFAAGSKNLRMVTLLSGEVWMDSIVPLDQVLGSGFSNQSLVELIPAIYVSLFLSYLLMSLLFFLKYGFYALILTILYSSMSKQFELGLSYGQVFMVCFYGMSLGMILTNFNIAMGLISPTLVSMVTIFVSIHFMTTALVSMRKDYHV